MESGAGIRSGGTKSEQEQGQDRKGGSSSQPCDEAEEAKTMEGRKEGSDDRRKASLAGHEQKIQDHEIFRIKIYLVNL